jgi:hypothetical protein
MGSFYLFVRDLLGTRRDLTRRVWKSGILKVKRRDFKKWRGGISNKVDMARRDFPVQRSVNIDRNPKLFGFSSFLLLSLNLWH